MTPGLKIEAAENRMLAKLVELWLLTPDQQEALLGDAVGTASDVRAAHLLGIHQRLRVLFPNNDVLRYGWMTAPNHAFDGLKPVEVVKRRGIEGLAAVRAYLDGALQQ